MTDHAGAPVEVVIGLVGGGETPVCGVGVGDRCVVSPFAALERGESTDPSGEIGPADRARDGLDGQVAATGVQREPVVAISRRA